MAVSATPSNGTDTEASKLGTARAKCADRSPPSASGRSIPLTTLTLDRPAKTTQVDASVFEKHALIFE